MRVVTTPSTFRRDTDRRCAQGNKTQRNKEDKNRVFHSAISENSESTSLSKSVGCLNQKL